MAHRRTKQLAQGCLVEKGIDPYTIDSRSASRHHIPSPGVSTAGEKGSAYLVQECRDSETLGETLGEIPSTNGAWAPPSGE